MVAPSPAAHSNAISTFKSAFDGGTRPNRFIVTGDIGSQGSLPNPLLVKAASMPVQTLGVMQVPFRGRVAKLPGDRAYAEWTITLLDEAKSSNARQKFEAWHEKFNTHKENITDQWEEGTKITDKLIKESIISSIAYSAQRYTEEEARKRKTRNEEHAKTREYQKQRAADAEQARINKLKAMTRILLDHSEDLTLEEVKEIIERE